MKRVVVASHLILFLGLNLPANNWKTDRDSLLTQIENLQSHSIMASPQPATPHISTEKDCKHAVLLKTNMLYNAVATPNIGLEVSVGKVWSVDANWMYTWWSNDARHRFWRVYGGDVELRRWFSPRRDSRSLMCGHHIGVYGQMLTYDIEWGGVGYLGDRWSWAAGFSYGYSLPVGKHFNIDFTLGIGYLEGDYMKYQPEDGCYFWESTHRRKWFGPTKAEVALVWYIGGRNLRKGGAR